MSTVTPKLGLIKPAITDEIHQTIVDLSNNFQKLDDIAEIYMNHAPESGFWVVKSRVWNLNPSIGNYAGWINVREGVAAPKWTALTPYSIGDLIVPTNDNGHYYECVQAGFSGIYEPTFPVTSGSSVKDIHNSSVWKAATEYQLNDIVLPSIDNNRFYVCTVAGVSGSAEPTWSTIDGGTVSDGMVVWTGYRIVIWEEKGTAAYFRPFGRID